MRAAAITIGMSAFLTASVAAAQEIKIEPDQQYFVIEVTKLSTFGKELNSAAKQGFRLMMSTTSEEGQRIQALMERVAQLPGSYQYRMVATFSEKTGDKEMNAAAAEGFRLLSQVRTSTFHKELKAAVEQGWKVVDMTYGQVLLERAKS
jgi:hypothetical protein